MADGDLKVQVRSLSLQPGDVVVIECDDAVSMETVARMKDVVQSLVQGHQVVVLGGGAHVGVLRLAEVDHG